MDSIVTSGHMLQPWSLQEKLKKEKLHVLARSPALKLSKPGSALLLSSNCKALPQVPHL